MTALEYVLKRDRAFVIGALIFVCVLAWGYMLAGAGMSMGSGSDAMSMPMAWGAGHALVVFVMWWIMMVAMMLPSAAPVVLLYARVSRTQQEAGRPFVPAGFFLAGYLLAWGLFSLVATLAQWWLEDSGLLSMMMASQSAYLSAAILIVAGLWQFTPLKQSCLRHCRSPLHFLVHGFRPGIAGALRMGAGHGFFCLGCCWFLMALLFYGGVMNLYWIAGLALYVLLEKSVPAGHLVSRLAGAALIVWGGYLLLAAS